VRKLIKKYPSLPDDLDNFIQGLQAGKISGDLLQHVGLDMYKARIKNSDNKKGKNAGYRVIYYLKKEQQLFLVTLYAKSEQEDISAQKIRAIIENWQPE
jgi:hypothetical protein